MSGAPHIKHDSLRRKYGEAVVKVYDLARQSTERPRILDLGAGEGSTTVPLLELGAEVTAVDVSENQLRSLVARCQHFGDSLNIRCEDVGEMLRTDDRNYDVIVACSFLHHIPDYLSLIRNAVGRLGPAGLFLSFQDPLRYDSVGVLTGMFTAVAYFSWRMFKGDQLGGLQRRIRRARGIYLDDCEKDNAEYHVTRNGVDQDAIVHLLQDEGFDCEQIRYFSTQSGLFQPIGTLLGVKNTFGVIAQRKK